MLPTWYFSDVDALQGSWSGREGRKKSTASQAASSQYPRRCDDKRKLELERSESGGERDGGVLNQRLCS